MEKESYTERSRRIGAHLKKLRVDRNMSQDDAAYEFGINEKAWKRYEQGAYLIPTELLLKLHDVWGADIHWLLFDTSFDFCDERAKKVFGAHDGETYGPRSERK